MKPIIKVENLSKQYRLGNIGTGTIKNDLKRWWYDVRGKEDPFLKIGETNDRTTKGNSDYAWALKDINFEVMPGEVLGIIGKNGAGKSTLLKILSKVTGPTTGRIDYNGRIGSLLEVGTGFHPELTGRENIFLNGAILGMTKHEIRSKLDEIIDFSGCERYIDTPVKRYSSGMTVRLGFAVAAHLEPEILVVDEVLAVGDAEFQRKAIGKMQDVSRKDGRTVLFVSHNLTAVRNLCSKSILIENGRLNNYDSTDIIINQYLGAAKENFGLKDAHREGIGNIRFVETWTENISNNKSDLFYIGDSIKIIAIINNLNTDFIQNVKFSVAISTISGVSLTDLKTDLLYQIDNKLGKSCRLEFTIPRVNLTSGTYFYNLFASANNIIEDWIKQAGKFEIQAGDYFKNGQFVDSDRHFLIDFDFSLNSSS